MYDKVPREVIWEVLERKSVNGRYIEVIKDMYSNVRTSVKTVSGVSESFEVRIGVHQGSALSPYLFILVLDELLKGVVKEAPWCMLFADDMGLIGDNAEEVQEMLEKVREALESRGLKINREKTEHMESKWKGEEDSGDRIRIQGTLLKKVEMYKYLGSVVQASGEVEMEVTSKIQAGWLKWRGSKGVLCDRKVPMKLKGKFYAAVVRPAMKYSSECWAIKKKQVQKLQVAEMRMLRLMCGVTRKDRISNEYVRGSLGVMGVCDAMAQNRLRWYGHVARKQEDDIVSRVWRSGRGGKLGRGRPEQTWDQVVKGDMKARGLCEEMVKDRNEWRSAIRIPTLAKLGNR